MPATPTDHGEMRDLAGAYVLGAVADAERAAFETHLATCAECQGDVRSLAPVANALAQAVPEHEPSPALRARVLNSVGAVASRETAGRSTDVQPSRVLLPWLAAAASLAVAITFWAQAATLRTRVGALEAQLRDATERAIVSERQMADARRTASEAQAQVAVLAAPDLRRIDLAGQQAAPEASGRAFWSRSRGLVFTASNLPALPPGRTYQLWVLTSQPAPLSAGVFKPDQNGRVTAVFETPLDLPTPTGMAATIEPEGGVPAPTGAMFLMGH
jgi:anti-sigma-K factor RskA